ncbi:hypothetical protein IMZ48_04360 [Candidatus Bathyarchaeota archaeon]|nr:hypothetical protein [Candidatus Bathyarchaeota archaeon]
MFPCDEGLVPRARTARVGETPEAEGEPMVGSAAGLATVGEALVARLDGVVEVSSDFCL